MPPKSPAKKRGETKGEYEGNTNRIRREYEENTNEIRREYVDYRLAPPMQMASRWLANGLGVAFPGLRHAFP
jgi:hypothetical protein